MKPKLRSDTLYVPTGDGVYLLNNRGSLTLRGQRLYDWLERLHPYLDGRRTLDELVAGVPPDHSRMVLDLVTLLAGRGFVKDTTDDESHTLAAWEEDTYAQEIAFIDYFCDSPGRRFEAFRNASVLVVGSGLAYVAMLRVLLQLGTRTLHGHNTGEAETPGAWLDDVVAAAGSRDPDQTVVAEPELPADLSRFGAVVYASDRAAPARAHAVDAACAAAGVPCGHLVVVGDDAWIGPVVPVGAPARWSDAWWRRARNHDIRLDSSLTDFLAVPTASIAAGHLGFEVFKHLAGIPDVELAGSIRRLDLATLAASTHPIQPAIRPGGSGPARPDGAGQTEAAFRERLAEARRVEVSESDFSTAVRDCVDPEVGLLLTVDEDDLVQLPLRVARAGLVMPGSAARGHRTAVAVIGGGLDFGSARRRAARRGCELYAASVVDPARLGPAAGGAPRVWALDLDSGETCLVAAADAFVGLRGAVPSAATTPLLASGSTWWEAVTRALLLACARAAGEDGPEVGLDALELTDASTQYAEQLAVARAKVTIHDLSAGLDLPTYGFRVGGAPVVTAADLTTAAAVQRGLERCLLQIQVGAPGGDGVSEIAAGWVRSPAGETDAAVVARLAGRLAAHGHRLAAVPLDHDPALRRAWPHVVNLVPGA
jgi:putative thiazole-containing bacteriocin maturation protein